MLNALDALRARAGELDVVLVCRGGGSRTDLAWLDSERLAHAVACFPVPVIVGIGHEQDHSVLDAVGRRAKTPTAAAALLVECVRGGHAALEQRGREIVRGAAERLRAAERTGSELARRVASSTRVLLQSATVDATRSRERTVRSARSVLAAARRRLDQRGDDLIRSARRDAATARLALRESASALASAPFRFLARERERDHARARRVRLADPRSVIERGYAVLRGGDGRVVTRPEAAPPGAALIAELRGGPLRLRSEGTGEGDA
jgi:exodeoxyribonuclease VII large subunit